MDSQSVRNTDSAENKGYDAGKKVSGIKRHIAVDTQGLPHAIHVTTADVTDRAGALAMFDQRRGELNRVQNVMVDGAYTGKPFAAEVQNLLGASVEVVKRNELHTFVVLPAFSPREDGGMGGGAVFRLAGEVPPTLEELREKAQYQPANGGSRLRGANPEEIVNRLSDLWWGSLGPALAVTGGGGGRLFVNDKSHNYHTLRGRGEQEGPNNRHSGVLRIPSIFREQPVGFPLFQIPAR